MKKIICIVLIAVQVWLLHGQTYTNKELQKYWYYRQRLTEKFVVTGYEPVSCGQGSGLSIPANSLSLDKDSHIEYKINFNDGTLRLGWYIAVLATETMLLFQEGDWKGLEQTKEELYYAMMAFERLDYVTEGHYYPKDNQCKLNGFLGRDDVPEDFLADNPDFNNGKYGTENFVSAWKDHNPPVKGKNDYMSPDQVAGLFLGFAVISMGFPKMSSSLPSTLTTYNGYNIYEKAKYYTQLIADYFHNNDWYGMYVPNGEKDDIYEYGTSFLYEFHAYGYATAAENIIGGDINKNDKYSSQLEFSISIGGDCFNCFLVNMGNPKNLSECLTSNSCTDTDFMLKSQKKVWQAKGQFDKKFGGEIGTFILDRSIKRIEIDIEEIDFDFKKLAINIAPIVNVVPQYHDFTIAYTLLIAAISNTWKTIDNDNYTSNALAFYGDRYGMEIYHLLYRFLHGYEHETAMDDLYLSHMKSAPCEGPQNHNGLSTGGTKGWRATNKYWRSYHAETGGNPNHNNDDNLNLAFNGLDYMLLHNLFRLVADNSTYGFDNFAYRNYAAGGGLNCGNVYGDYQIINAVNLTTCTGRVYDPYQQIFVWKELPYYINSGQNLNIKARELNIEAEFEAKLGSTFTFDVFEQSGHEPTACDLTGGKHAFYGPSPLVLISHLTRVEAFPFLLDVSPDDKYWEVTNIATGKIFISKELHLTTSKVQQQINSSPQDFSYGDYFIEYVVVVGSIDYRSSKIVNYAYNGSNFFYY